MRKSLSKSEEENWRETSDSDKYCLGNLDLLNLRLNVSSDENRLHNQKRCSKERVPDKPPCEPTTFRQSTASTLRNRQHHHHSLEKTEKRSLIANPHKLPQGYGHHHHHHRQTSEPIPSDNLILLYSKEKHPELVFTEPISQTDFLFPTKKKNRSHIIDVVSEDRMTKINSKVTREESGSFPFKLTPSGNFKVHSEQVVFSSNKLSVLVSDPQNTRINIHPESIRSNMAQEPTDFSKTSAMDTIMSQAGFSSLGSLIGNTPVRSGNKEASEYESKQTSEILDPELNLGRLGYSGTDTISWDKVVLPEKKNLYLELYARITNYTNADCKVYIDNEEFNCHLIVLQCYSELFDAYIAVKKVEIPSDKCSASSFAFIYEWMITGEPSYRDLTRENVLDIFNSAKYLKIKDLVEQCWAFIDNTEVFNEDTGFLLYMDAKKRSLPEVRELMLPRIQGFFLMLVSSQDWLELELDDVKNLLQSNYICVNCEMEIFMSAVRWLKHDWGSRDHCKYEVLDCVRFGNIAPWQLVDIKRNPENPDFMELAKDARICKMIDDGLAFVIIKYWYGQENDDFQHWNTVLGLQEPPPRNWSGSDKTYFTYREFLIYLDQYRRNQLIEKNKPKMLNEKKFNPDLSKTSQSPMANCADKLGAKKGPTMDEFLSKKKAKLQDFISGSNDRAARIIQSAYRLYKEKRDTVKQVPQMLQKKRKILEFFGHNRSLQMRLNQRFVTVNLNKYLTDMSLFQKEKETILIFGGLDPHAPTGTGRNTAKNIFRYVAEDNMWQYVGDLPQPRHQHCVVFLKGRVYLVGGSDPHDNGSRDGCKAVESVWSFDPINRSWFNEQSMNVCRKNFGLVVCNQSMFAIGGQGRKQESLKSMEKFSIIQGVWEKKTSMSHARTGAAYANYRNCIWAAGGLSGSKKYIVLDSVECYDLKTDQWTEVKSLNFPRCFSSMSVMSDRLYVVGGAGRINETDKTSCSVGVVDVWNYRTNDWENITEMSIPRHGHCLAYLGTQIFIIGGVTTIYKRALSNTDCFCCIRERFVRGVACLPSALSGHAAITLPPAILMSN